MKYEEVTDDFSMVIPDLKEHTQYIVAVTASTSAGEGDSTSVQVLTAERKCIEKANKLVLSCYDMYMYVHVM